MATSAPTQESFLVVGGCGFLGRRIVEQLVERGEKAVAVFDLVQRHFDENVSFYTGDITFPDDLSEAITKSRADVIIHTASPVHGMGAEIYRKVNVVGTQTIIDACLAHNVRKLVYTSSAGVVYNGTQHLVDVDERMSVPEVPLDAYNETKAQAEKLVLAANGAELQTCALRPAGIFGEGDRQLLTGLQQVMRNGQTKFQIGTNENLFDWTYVGNVAHAHLLASDRLGRVVSPYEFTFPLSENNKTVGDYRVPTSEARPLGPIRQPTEEEKRADEKFRQKKRLDDEDDNDLQPVLRTRMDQFAKATDPEYTSEQDKQAAVAMLKSSEKTEGESGAVGIMTTPIDPELRVAGQAYFITNSEPLYFWDFNRAVWYHGMNHIAPYHIKMPPVIGLALAALAEGWSWLMGKEAGFTRFRVNFATQKRYFNIERSRRLLGYEPIWGVEEALGKTLEWFNAEEAKKVAGETSKNK
ncbi:hypothetical protein FFLO_03426 [Filobasidium floriforme]|uniref:3-beta hydroxysteroid dehydrogenase/isomerase domain-containing protein n=1 Tax=Filobasidium floriforme TaxID=5210 RepID=A0A8K0JM48_9TREE|nr:hypothetical protein FFLO_03426 [Filobasidium floriforme]